MLYHNIDLSPQICCVNPIWRFIYYSQHISFNSPPCISLYMCIQCMSPMPYGILSIILSTYLSISPPIFVSLHIYICVYMYVKVRGAFVSAVYNKVLRLGPKGNATYTPGVIVDLMSTDTDRIVNFCQSFHQVISHQRILFVGIYVSYAYVLIFRQVCL